jgi:hypothetical protein
MKTFFAISALVLFIASAVISFTQGDMTEVCAWLCASIWTVAASIEARK